MEQKLGKDSFYERMAFAERIIKPLFFEVTERKNNDRFNLLSINN